MSLDQIDQMVRRANPVPHPRALKGRFDEATTFTLIEPEPTPSGTPRPRWPILAATASVVAVIVGGLVFAPRDHAGEPQVSPPGSTAAVQRRVGFLGLPPEGATPSQPERGEIVFEIRSCAPGPEEFIEWNGVTLTLFADGRLIWNRYADLPQGASPEFTGWFEQRLNAEGVDLMRAELRGSGLLRQGEQECTTRGWYGGFYYGDGRGSPSPPGGMGFASPPGGIGERLTDPESWLPASAWEDRKLKAYVPAEYHILMFCSPRQLFHPGDVERLAAQLPPVAEEILLAKEWESQGCAWYTRANSIFTTDEVRAFAEAVEEVGFVQGELPWGHPGDQLVYYPGSYPASDVEASPRLVSIQFCPLLPHQTGHGGQC